MYKFEFVYYPHHESPNNIVYVCAYACAFQSVFSCCRRFCFYAVVFFLHYDCFLCALPFRIFLQLSCSSVQLIRNEMSHSQSDTDKKYEYIECVKSRIAKKEIETTTNEPMLSMCWSKRERDYVCVCSCVLRHIQNIIRIVEHIKHTYNNAFDCCGDVM